ncbi:hypothetical protein Hanom_Chr11g01006711 [Helianthus anomalus]
MQLMATPNRVFGEQFLVAAEMSDKWPAHNKLYQSVFPTFGDAMGVRPLGDGEVFWYEQIKNNFMYPPARIFASPPSTIEEILYLSSEESVGSSNEELSSWPKIFAGVLRDLGIDPEEKKTKKVATKKSAPKNKVTVEAGATSKKAGGARTTADIPQKSTFCFRQSNLEDYIVASDLLEGLSRIGEKSESSTTATSKSSGSAGSSAPESGATPSSHLARPRLTLKKPEVNTKGPEAKKTKFTIVPPKIIPEKEAEIRVEEPAGNVMPEKEILKEIKTAVTTVHDKTQGPEVVRITRLDQPLKNKGPKVYTAGSAA